jgi:hypothetical protein
MSLTPIKRLLVVGSLLLISIGTAGAQTPSPEAMKAARELVTTLKITDQYKALLPAILLGIKRTVTQDRPEIERDYDAMGSAVEVVFTPHYNTMVDSITTIYANTFSVTELRQIEAFYRQPAGQKLLEKSGTLRDQAAQIGQDAGRKATEDLRTRLTQLLREKGHKL